MKRCLIVGGGLAGLSAAVHLSKNNYFVELIEGSPKPGGRAYSFIDKRTGMEIDNGQHLLMGCYQHTLELLDIIHSKSFLHFPGTLSATFIDNNKHYTLSVPSFLPHPINLAAGLLNFSYLTLSEKIKVSLFLAKLKFGLLNTDGLTAEEWLRRMKQDAPGLKAFWELIIVSALNCRPKDASANILHKVLREMFLTGTFQSTLLIPEVGLSRLFPDPAISYISNNGGKVNLGERALSFEISGNNITSVITNKREINKFDFVISAVPVYSEFLKNLISPDILSLYKFSVILSVHLLKDNGMPDSGFIGFLNSPIHWVFFHKQHLSLIISSVDERIFDSEKAVIEILGNELYNKINIRLKKDNIIKIIREKRATFIPDSNLDNKRISQTTKFSNLFLAGDYTDTGLPSTIEGAVLSGKNAANLVLSS